MNTFEQYYQKELADLKKYAKRDKLSLDQWILKAYRKTMKEFKEWKKSLYEKPSCHSFWHRECENKDILCNVCSEYYSRAEKDKKN